MIQRGFLDVRAAHGRGGDALAAMCVAAGVRRIGMPCASGRHGGFERRAERDGVAVLALPVYQLLEQPSAAANPPELDAFLFTSPSAVAAWRDATSGRVDVRAIAIEETTRDALFEAGFEQVTNLPNPPAALIGALSHGALTCTTAPAACASRALSASSSRRPRPQERPRQPHFVVADDAAEVPVDALPGISRQGVEPLLRTVEQDLELGITSALLFGVVDTKDAHGTHGHDPNGPVQRAVQALKQRFGDDLQVITDVCLCTYTDHGHCGVVEGDRVKNDESLPLLARQAVSLAEAGADMVAPSDMMDGRVLALRDALDAEGHSDCAIMSYSAKHARTSTARSERPPRRRPRAAAGQGRKTYQMDYRNRSEAVREAVLDVEEGADVIMVKPALAYLDVIQSIRGAVDRPVAAYLVSGEYAAVEALAEKGLADRAALVHEHLTAVRRAGRTS